MIKISAQFVSDDFADFAIGELKSRIEIEKTRIASYADSDETIPLNYPIKPEYIEPSHTQYLEGMPHVLSNGPIFNQYFEPEHKKDARLEFVVSEQSKQQALNVLMKFGAYDVKIENEN